MFWAWFDVLFMKNTVVKVGFVDGVGCLIWTKKFLLLQSFGLAEFVAYFSEERFAF